jgi:c-di-GMP-binding flagellar brake protein YcgR
MGQLLRQQSAVGPASVELGDLNLIEAQRSRAIIDVAVAGLNQSYQSVILGVDVASSSMLIDELFPSGFIGLVDQALTINVRRMDGSRVSFTTRIIERSRIGETDNYRVALPANIDYKQRREVFRLDVAQEAAVRSEFCTADHQFCAAQVLDVSATGVRLELQNSIEIAAGDVLTGLDFEFAGNHFQCQAEVRHVRNDRFGGIAIGVAFRNFPRPQQRLLERSIMQLQRRSVRLARAEQVVAALG